jgi:hypothetical protein
VFIDGGNPIGGAPADRLNVTTAGDVTLNPGPEADEGSLVVTGINPLSYDHVETLSVSGATSAMINGTNGPDGITVVARDSDYDASADGVNDFTVAVNEGMEVLFVGTPALNINALGGSDEISITAPDPNPTTAPAGAWDVDVTVDGGQPTGSDSVVFGTPNSSATVRYTPAGVDAGSLEITNQNSTTTLRQIEHLVYDAEGDDELVTVVGTGSNETFTHTPGDARDAGRMGIDNSTDTLLGIFYVNLGLSGRVNVAAGGGADVLVVEGTAGDDSYVVNTAAAQILHNDRVGLF